MTSRLNWPIRSITRVKYHQLTWYNSLRLWRWLQHRLAKRQSRSTTAVLFRTTFTRTIILKPTYETTPGFKHLTVIIKFSKSAEEHLVHLEEVWRRLREANVKLNPKKCFFVKQKVEYLGHVVTLEGVSPNLDKVHVVQEFPTPTNLKELRNFLGLTNYYRRFVKGFFSNRHSPNCIDD